ncbi:MAG: hypothetical protein JNL88_13145 [Bacteroidia bacterium]|nr:hypothetical protein [Bacteroidia bacterium]
MSVIIKTDEMGAFKEVKNWKELKAEMDRCLGLVKKELKDLPNIDELVRQVSNVYTSKEAIESVAIKDIQQFYTYHGGKYTLGEEVKGQIKLPNLYGGEPFDAEVTLQMDEINFEDENAIIRMWQTADSKQLTAATYEYLSKMAKASGVKSPSQEEIPPLQNQTMVASRLHGPSGWVIYSLETKEVSAENVTNVEERIIEIK